MSFTSSQSAVSDDVEKFIVDLLAEQSGPTADVLKQLFSNPLAKELWLRLADSLFLSKVTDAPHIASVDALGIFRPRPPAGGSASTLPSGGGTAPARPVLSWLWNNRQTLIQAGLTLAGVFGLKLPPGLGTALGGLLGGAGGGTTGTPTATPSGSAA